MKKIYLLAFVIITSAIVSQAQTKIGIKASGMLTDQRMNSSKGSSLFSNSRSKDYQAGFITEFRMSERFYLQPQLLYTRKSFTLLSSTGAPDTHVKINYAELPVNLIYKIPVSFGKVYGGAGVSFSYAFSGNEQQGAQTRKLFSGSDNWRHADLGINLTAGVELNNGFFVSLNSQKGRLNINKTEGVNFKSRSISASIGYMIDWQKLKRHS